MLRGIPMWVRSLLSVLFVAILPAPAFAHLLITSPTPRVSADNIKQANAPCGGPRGDVIHSLDGGQMMTIEFDETIAHPGHFELKFSEAGDTRWQTLDANIPDQGGVGSYAHTFQVPDVNCTDCTIQFIQVMTDRNPPVNYYACLDVAITATTGPDDMGSTTADMGLPAQADTGVTTPPVNNTNPPANNSNPPVDNNPPVMQPDLGNDGGVASVNGSGEACSTSGSGQTGDLGMLALMLFGLTLSGRRRSARDSSEAR